MLDFIPMPHSVSIEKSGELDAWGERIATGETATYKARVSPNTKRESISIASGEDVVYTASIFLSGNVPVDYSDSIVWEDSVGRSYRKSPLEIVERTDLSGKVIGIKVVV